MADKKGDKNDLTEMLLSAQSELGFGMAILDAKTGRILRANPALSDIFGFPEKDLVALPSLASLVPADNQLAMRERLKHAEGNTTFEMIALHKNRSRIWTEVRLRHLKIKGETVVVAILNDITRRREAEEQVLLLETITLAVNEARDFQSALGIVVRKVCVATGWEYGLAWVPSPDGKTLSVGKSAYGAADKLERFRKAMSEITLTPGDDLPGRAWALRQPQFADEVLLLRSFRRQTILREFGVQVSMAIPVVADDKVVAILEFCVTERHQHAKDFFAGLASAIAPQLGSVFNRKKAEEERDRFFALSPDLMCVMGFDGFFRHLNPSWERTLGYTIEELRARPAMDFIHPDDRQRTMNEAAPTLRQGELRLFENRYIAKDGTHHWLLWNAIFHPAENLIYAVARDITERKAAEEEIRRTNSFFDQIIENIPDMIFIKDAKHLRFVKFNKAGEKLLGMDRADLIGKNDYDFFPTEEADFFIEKDRQVLKEGRLVDIPEEIIHTKKGVRVLHTKKIPILDANNKPLYLLGISEDVTDRKKSE